MFLDETLSALRPGKQISPFLTDAQAFLPKTLENAMDYSMFLYYSNPTFMEGSRRLVSHFITSLTAEGKGMANEYMRDWIDYYTDGIGMLNLLLKAGMDDSCYGNAFVYIAFPFDRVLVDRRGDHYAEWSLNMFDVEKVKFDLSSLTYNVPDPRNPAVRVSLPFKDKRSMDRERIALRTIDPSRVVLFSGEYAGNKRVCWRFTETMRSNVKAGRLTEVNYVPIGMLEAIRDNKDWLFSEDEVFHISRPGVSGMSNRGWGIPPVITNYPSIHQLGVYRKIDENIGKDFMIPLRLITPAATSGEVAAQIMQQVSEWSSHIYSLMEARKIDPTVIGTLPFPAQLSQFGGDGRSLAPKNELDWHNNTMLDGMGFPAELYHGQINIQLAPVRIRFFERANEHIAWGYRNLVTWVNRRVLSWCKVEHFNVKLEAPSVADDITKMNAEMQLLSSGDISYARVLSKYGINDPSEEYARRLKEDSRRALLQAEEQKSLETQMSEGDLGATLAEQSMAEAQQQQQSMGGAGPTPAGVATTPLTNQSDAQELASKWLSMDESSRKIDMQRVKATDPNMYAYAMMLKDEMLRSGESQGRQQTYQAAQGQ